MKEGPRKQLAVARYALVDDEIRGEAEHASVALLV